MTLPDLYLGLTRALAVLLLMVAGAWTIQNLGDVPHYGDTEAYMRLAAKDTWNSQRGFVYPWVLRTSTELFLEGRFPKDLNLPPQAREIEESRGACVAPRGLMWLQLFQVAFSGLALWFFLRAIGLFNWHATSSGSGRLTLTALFLLLLFDPVVHQMNFSLMTDGLTFSASLLFLGGLVALRRGTYSAPIALIAMLVGFLLASGLRVEKAWVLIATWLITSCLWWWLGTRGPQSAVEGLPQRLGAAGGLLVLALLAVTAVQRSGTSDVQHLPSYDTFVHMRLVFPHLSQHYDALPERTRRILSREDAETYDSHVNGIRRVVVRVSGRDPEIRDQLREDALSTVFPREFGSILVDTVRDAVENVLATPFLYIRLGAWQLLDQDVFRRLFYSDGTIASYEYISYHHPWVTALYFGLGGLLMVLLLPIGASRLRRGFLEGPFNPSVSDWIPLLVFCLVNGLFFALAFNYTNFRYSMNAHAFFVLVLYVCCLLGRTPLSAGHKSAS